MRSPPAATGRCRGSRRPSTPRPAGVGGHRGGGQNAGRVTGLRLDATVVACHSPTPFGLLVRQHRRAARWECCALPQTTAVPVREAAAVALVRERLGAEVIETVNGWPADSVGPKSTSLGERRDRDDRARDDQAGAPGCRWLSAGSCGRNLRTLPSAIVRRAVVEVDAPIMGAGERGKGCSLARLRSTGRIDPGEGGRAASAAPAVTAQEQASAPGPGARQGRGTLHRGTRSESRRVRRPRPAGQRERAHLA